MTEASVTLIYASDTDLTSVGALLTQLATSEYPAVDGRIYPP